MTGPDEEQDIQEVLDIGYRQLDGFVTWLEESAGIDTRGAQQDCFNAESLIDYLANYEHRQATAITEYDLRWFLFSHYIRKVGGDAQIEARLLESIRRFFRFLETAEVWEAPAWLPDTLDDDDYYQRRRQAYSDLNELDERGWKTAFRNWCTELEDDLDARCLWLPADMGQGMQWGDAMGWREATLRREAMYNWQSERDELLLDGLDFEAIRDRLGESYLMWLDTPQDRLDDETPRDVILAERAGADQSDDSEDDDEED
jgi:hypothetical protein